MTVGAFLMAMDGSDGRLLRRSSRVGSHHGISYNYWPKAKDLFQLAREPGKRTGVRAKVWVDKGVEVGPYGGIGVYTETEKAAITALPAHGGGYAPGHVRALAC